MPFLLYFPFFQLWTLCIMTVRQLSSDLYTFAVKSSAAACSFSSSARLFRRYCRSGTVNSGMPVDNIYKNKRNSKVTDLLLHSLSSLLLSSSSLRFSASLFSSLRSLPLSSLLRFSLRSFAYQEKEIDEDGCVSTQRVIRHTAQPHKVLKCRRTLTTHHSRPKK